ncbi:MAG TPA: SUMF1/EgtB/PvdO family nonheme iron enzyme [Candidatus Cloacimonadota bacterium]|nr:SUMF1/EgtB/PvdO family nonheme iron enzyme [Candidatus Cloacimonadota bacterium]
MEKKDKYPTQRKKENNTQGNQQINDIINLSSGDLINGQYEIVEEIHRGELSKIYLAEDLNTSRFKALKVFGKYHDIQMYYDHLRMNITLLSKLNHPNILKIHNFIDSDYIFMDMDYIDGETLSQQIYAKKIDKSQLLPYAIQIANALNEAHKNNVFHSDLKPGNIMINRQGIVKVIDFSHNLFFGGVQQSVLFTPEYIAPEVAGVINSDDNQNFDPVQQDIFAYGVTLYEMIYKKLPFNLLETRQLDYQIPARLRKSKKPIDKVIKKCIFRYPEDRYQTFEDILADLTKLKNFKTLSFKEFKKALLKKTKFKKINPEYKKDLKYLWMALLSLFLVLPFYLIVQNNINIPDKEIEIDSPPLSVFVNMNYAGESPINVQLSKDDHIEFKDDQQNSIFETHYQNQKKIHLEIKNKKIYLNNKLKGQIIENHDDLPLKKNLEYIRSEIRLTKRDFKKQKNKRLVINLSSNFDKQDISELPLNTRFINLSKNKRLKSLHQLNQMTNLVGLNLSETNIDMNELKQFKNLRHLNVSKSRLNRISPLLMNSKLKNLDISETHLKSINAIDNLKNLENISLSVDSLKSINPLLKIAGLKSVSTNSNYINPTVNSEVVEKLNQNKSIEMARKRYVIKKKNHFNLIIFFLVTLIMASIIFLIFKMIFIRSKHGIATLISEIEETLPEQNIETSKKYSKREIDFIKKSIEDKRFYSPAKENALFYISALLHTNPNDAELISLKNQVLDTLKTKKDLHHSRLEYEAVYQITNACNQFFPDPSYSKQLKAIQKKLIKNYSVKMIQIHGGEFTMGDFTIQYSDNGNPAHQIFLDSFKMSQTVITNRQFCEFLNAEGNQKEYGIYWYKEDSQYARIEKVKGKFVCKEPYADFPVFDVNWFGAKRFCEWKGGRLPSEAEWEYAARSRGKEFIYAFGNTPDKSKANYLVNMNDTLWHSVFPVKSFKPNKLKLFEMSGNILEWCNDWFDKYYYDFSPNINPKGPETGEMKVVRGGAWCFGSDQMKTFYRGSAKPLTRNNFIGFRMLIPERKDIK